MHVASIPLNILWFVFGGFVAALLWLLAGCAAAITIVALPYARACFEIAKLSAWPFGRDAVKIDTIRGRERFNVVAFVANAVWFALVGFWLALFHVAVAAVAAITIVGLPFAYAHLKLAGLALAPVGYRVVDTDFAKVARMAAANARLGSLRADRIERAHPGF